MLLARNDVTNLMHLPRAALRPHGDVVLCDVARDAADDLLARLADAGVSAQGSIAVDTVDSLISRNPHASAEFNYRDDVDAVVWQAVEAQAEQSVRDSWTFHAFLTLGVALACIAVKLDSAIVVIAAMVVSPDFSPVAAACVGTIRRSRRDLVLRGTRLLASGFLRAVAIVTLLALVGVYMGWLSVDDLLAPRPQTDFIWTPDRWSFVVAILAGAAGALALTSSHSNALVGVFIAVTTVPAAGNLALALAVGFHGYMTSDSHTTLAGTSDSVASEIGGSVAQLVVNVGGMFVAGVATLLVTEALQRRRARLLDPTAARTSIKRTIRRHD
ncbi:DUF389 domain-containing protein [Burkholderia pyrrocinia]|uniref:DUF389 domain-containing protein n=1 Tax=Burkholderia pyrrocinia TaxID=60550 RepID=UPI001404AF9E|nr:DUF389 domain-containing protein [Burkholderia pyrrocinia]